MSYCTYCFWKHPGMAKATCIPGRPMKDKKVLGLAWQHCSLWPTAKLSPCLPGTCPGRERHG